MRPPGSSLIKLHLCGTDLRPTSVFSRRNCRRHGYLQLVAKTLYAVDSFFHAPPANDSGQFHWWSHVFEPSALEPKFFVRNLLRSYDPVTYSILFGKSEPRR